MHIYRGKNSKSVECKHDKPIVIQRKTFVLKITVNLFLYVNNYSAKCHMTHTSLHTAGRSDGYEHLLAILRSVTYTSCTSVHQVKEFLKFFISVVFNPLMFMPDCHFFLILPVCMNSHCSMQDFIVRGIWMEGNVAYGLNCKEILRGKGFFFNLKV
jgi:hypothetical protein